MAAEQRDVARERDARLQRDALRAEAGALRPWRLRSARSRRRGGARRARPRGGRYRARRLAGAEHAARSGGRRASTTKQVSDGSRAAKSAAVSFSTLEGGSIRRSPKAACASASNSPARDASAKPTTVEIAASTAERGRNGGERGLGLGAVRAAGLRHVGPPPPPLPPSTSPPLRTRSTALKRAVRSLGDADDDARPCRPRRRRPARRCRSRAASCLRRRGS